MEQKETKLEVQIARLDEKVQAMQQKENEHHLALLGEIKDLREGLVKRLEQVEIKKLLADDFIRFKKDDFIPYSKKTDILWDLRWKLIAFVFLGGILGEIILRFFWEKLT